MNPKSPEDPIEALLSRLQPAPPDQALMDRLRAARPRRPALRLVWAAPLAAAAAVALALRTPAPAPTSATPPPSAPAAPTIVENRRHLMGIQDLGVVRDDHDQAVRLVRTTWIDDIGRAGDPQEKRESWVREEIVPIALPVF